MGDKHTPAHWYWFDDNTLWSERGELILESGDDGKPWGMHSGEIHHHYDYETKEANKTIIAASPEMYKALKLALKALESVSDEMTVGERYTNAVQYIIDALVPARTVVAKVEGE